jgi:hypothetical protein
MGKGFNFPCLKKRLANSNNSSPQIMSSEAILTDKAKAQRKLSIEGEIWRRRTDAGYLNSNGRLWLLGRCAARVQRKGNTLPFAADTLPCFPFVVVRTNSAISNQSSAVLARGGRSSSPQANSSGQATQLEGLSRLLTQGDRYNYLLQSARKSAKEAAFKVVPSELTLLTVSPA